MANVGCLLGVSAGGYGDEGSSCLHSAAGHPKECIECIDKCASMAKDSPGQSQSRTEENACAHQWIFVAFDKSVGRHRAYKLFYELALKFRVFKKHPLFWLSKSL